MTENIKDTALSYFKTFSEKNIDGLREMFDDNVTLRDWDIDKKGIESVLKANLNIFQNVKTIHVVPQNIISENNFVFAELKIIINLNSGESQGTAWGCDLSKKYVEINSEYTT